MGRGVDKSRFAKTRDEQGRRLCRVCRSVLTGRKTSFCDDACVREYLLLTDAGFQRAAVQKRDAGVCAACGCDTEKMRRISRIIEGKRHGLILHPVWKAQGFVKEHLWEMDHIREVNEGGGNELENLQTLCLPCHTKKTAAYNRTRGRR